MLSIPIITDPELIWEYIDQEVSDIPHVFDLELFQRSLSSYHKRESFVRQYSWAIPNRDVINEIITFSEGARIVELGAGNGLWSSLIKHDGGFVYPIDMNHDIEASQAYYNNTYSNLHEFCDVTRVANANTAVKLIDEYDIIMFCWPSYADSWAHKYLTSTMPNKLIYIGEGCGGCTADDAFHELLYDHYELLPCEYQIKSWFGIHDSIHYYRKIV
jgi:hypothetical protein